MLLINQLRAYVGGSTEVQSGDGSASNSPNAGPAVVDQPRLYGLREYVHYGNWELRSKL